jgi:hypothetical protein
MVSGLPDRPLSVLELEALVAADATGFVIPATSESLRDSGHGGSQVYDVLISVDDTVSAVVYDEEGGWTVLEKFDTDRPQEAAIASVIERRGYDIENEEAMLDFINNMYEMLDKEYK